jgi:hypothetical protein
MANHRHKDDPAQVRIEAAGGGPIGAGILLDDWHVLTCAHVVRNAGAQPGGTAPHVVVSSWACQPHWDRKARAPREWWVHEEAARRGDVALLRLDRAAPCGIETRLWRTPTSGGRMRIYGFPEFAEGGVHPVMAKLGDFAGSDGEWRDLVPAEPQGVWIEEGYSGAGVVAQDGEFEGRVIGMVTNRYDSGSLHGAYMLPTEAIEEYLGDHIGRSLAGARVIQPDSSRSQQPYRVLEGPLRRALARELTRLLGSDWSGTVLVGTGGRSEHTAGQSWLLRLVGTADPAVRAGAMGAGLDTAPEGTVLSLGSVDAAYDASGASVGEVRAYLVERFGLQDGSSREVRDQLLRRTPPACLVISGVDRAGQPGVLVRELLGPLAARAPLRGMRLVLGFENPSSFGNAPPYDLAHQVFLDPDPLPGPGAADVSAGEVSAGEAEEAVRRLDTEELAAALLHRETGVKFFPPLKLPAREAPRLRVRLAVARDRAPHPELGAIQARARAARKALSPYEDEVRHRIARRDGLLADLDLCYARAVRLGLEEDEELRPLYTAATEALHIEPVELAAARRLVRRYTEEVNRHRSENDH